MPVMGGASRRKTWHSYGVQLALAGVSGHPHGVLEVMALTKVFDLHPDASAAVGALRQRPGEGEPSLAQPQ